MLEEIELIRERTKQFPELASAHHFLFDLPLCKVPLPADFKCEFVIMGINPGEAIDEWDRHPGPTEETSAYDFHAQEKGRGRGSKRWRDLCIDILQTDQCIMLQTDQCIMTEFFFWSSRNVEHFEVRYGELQYSNHLPFCTEMNKRLLDYRQPKAVVCPGLGAASIGRWQYGLKFVDLIRCNETSHKLVEVYEDARRRWFFTKHWTGSHGFSNVQKEQVSKVILR